MYINSIAKFMELSEPQQSDILRGIKMKEMLFEFLENKEKTNIVEAHKVVCNHCEGKGTIELEPRNNNDIHASSIHLCPRKLWFDVKGYGNAVQQKNSPILQLIFKHGSKLHEMLQEYGLQGAWKTDEFTTYEPEVKILPSEEECLQKGVEFFPLAKKYKVRSAIDARIKRFRVDNVRDIGTVWVDVLKEYKSIAAGGFAYLTGPKQVHKMQGTLYQALTNVPIMVYAYFSKGDDFMCYPQKFDGFIWGQIEDKINEVLLMEDEVDPDIAVSLENTAWNYNKEECTGNKYNSPCVYYNKFCFPEKNLIPQEVVKKRGRKKKD